MCVCSQTHSICSEECMRTAEQWTSTFRYLDKQSKKPLHSGCTSLDIYLRKANFPSTASFTSTWRGQSLTLALLACLFPYSLNEFFWLLIMLAVFLRLPPLGYFCFCITMPVKVYYYYFIILTAVSLQSSPHTSILSPPSTTPPLFLSRRGCIFHGYQGTWHFKIQ